jgi:hypothetical protein
VISPQKRQEIIDALRRGTVPSSSLDAFAVGLEGVAPTLEEELDITPFRRTFQSGAGPLHA